MPRSAAVAEPVEATTSTRPPASDWRRRYARYLTITDAITIVWIVFGTQIAWLGLDADLATRNSLRFGDFSYWAFSTLLVILWMVALALNDTRSYRVTGVGPTEYKRIFDASFALFGAIAIIAFLFRIDVARGFLLLSLPLGVGVLFIERWMWRQWLAAQRAAGLYSARVLLVGSESSIAQVARELERTSVAGYRVVGSCVPSGRIGGTIPGTEIPVMGSVAAIERAITATNADTVVVTSTDDLPADKVKEISWALEAGRQHLVLAPNIVDIAGPRIHTRPVAGLPLIHVETPRFSRGQRALKRTFDIVAASVALVIFSLLLVGVALAVKLTSPGPVLYKQERIGLNGEPFRMLKFRSMRVGADAELAQLLEEQGTSTQPLFKVMNDPRITPIGRFIRKYSLDEFPQLFNVLGGSMSVVGPRPQIAAEVALYSDRARRRLLARPGITGLWQVSGRSSLDWAQTVRLDLYYVENWSLMGDLAILVKTVRTVFFPGATAH
ncbi:sugar transferase [Microbacterium lacus]|uniref:sugar transferase n=1 Tax=Microbacterium lacus TaxID=415217 RepID=UPI000C2BC599|nr:sugar transferase [Microbacterium lacus]